MKSTHEPFDKELKGRLLNYTEEPDKDLWQGIVRSVVSLGPEPRWVVWTNRLSVLLIALSGVFFLTVEERNPEKEMLGELSSSYSDIDTIQVRHPTGKDDLSVSGNVVRKQTILPGDKPRAAEVQPSRQRRLGLETPATLAVSALDEKFSIEVKSDLSLPRHENVPDVSISAATDAASKTPTTKLVFVKDVPDNEDRTSAKKETQDSDSSEKKGRKKSFALYFTAMPTFGYQRIEAKKDDQLYIQGIKRIPAFSADRLGVRLEAGAEVPLSKRWMVFGGLLYFQRKQTIDYVERQNERMVTGTEGEFVEQYKYTPKSIEYELRNAGLQIGLTYRLWMARGKSITAAGSLLPGRRFLHVLGSGIEFHKALDNTRALEKAEYFTDPSTYVFFNVYYRMQYPHIGKLRAIFQPTFNYSFYINENLNAPFYVKPYGLGLILGCTYNFR
ncbi:MAG: hypothetical protein WD824_10880 [Cyclobacteriaceae bacterium]